MQFKVHNGRFQQLLLTANKLQEMMLALGRHFANKEF
jgi:hypothetical protein